MISKLHPINHFHFRDFYFGSFFLQNLQESGAMEKVFFD